VALFVRLLRLDWSGVPFALQHVAKVLTFAVAMLLIGQTLQRCTALVMPAMDPFDNPFAARTLRSSGVDGTPFRTSSTNTRFAPRAGTPAGAGHAHGVRTVRLMHEYVFGVATGRVQGWQMLFFTVQGCARGNVARAAKRSGGVAWWAVTFRSTW